MLKDEILKEISEDESFLGAIQGRYIYPNIPERKIKNATKSHHIGLYEQILYLIDNTVFGSAEESSVITVSGLSINGYSEDDRVLFMWADIESVDFIDGYYYFFYDLTKDFYKKVDGRHLITNIKSEYKFGKPFSQLLTRIASKFENKQLILYDEINRKFIEGLEDDANELSKQYFKLFGDNGLYSSSIRFIRGSIYYKQGKFDNALNEINYEINNYSLENQSISLFKLNELKSLILNAESDNYSALQILQNTLPLAQTNEDKFRIKNSIDKTYELFIQNFDHINYSKRKLIFVDSEIRDYTPTTFSILDKNILPDLKFPMGHPVEDEFYVGHPYNSKHYFPLETSENELFIERINEYCYLLQCLGATQIDIISVKGLDTEKLEKENVNTKSEGKYQGNKGELDITNNTESNKEESLNQTIGITQNFSPVKKPYLPNDLIWFNHESSWQTLFKQRMNGSILKHVENIDTNNNRLFTDQEYHKVKAEFSNLLVTAKIEHTKDINKKFKQKEFTHWSITVTFAPITDLLE